MKDISGADKLKPTQLDQVIQPTDSVQALSESLLALSKHLVNRIDVIRAARQQAAYHTALSRTPEADPVLLRTLQRRCFKRTTSMAPSPLSSMQSDSATFLVFTPPGERLNLRRSGSRLT